MSYSKPPANLPELIALALSLFGVTLSLFALIHGAAMPAYLLLIGGFAALLGAYCFHE